MKNLCRSKGGSCKCLQKSTWGRGVQKVQKLVYVVYGWHPMYFSTRCSKIRAKIFVYIIVIHTCMYQNRHIRNAKILHITVPFQVFLMSHGASRVQMKNTNSVIPTPAS